jgi:hypothetical protein
MTLHRRRGKEAGVRQLWLPLASVQGKPEPEPEAEPEAADQDQDQQADFSSLAEALQAARSDFQLRAAYTPQHCDALEKLLKTMQRCVQRSIAVLEQPQYASDQRLLSRLWPFHRTIGETLVVLRGVRCFSSYEDGRHLTERTGAYWQLWNYVSLLQRDCQFVASFERVTPQPASALSA